jgi:hypothetical protein
LSLSGNATLFLFLFFSFLLLSDLLGLGVTYFGGGASLSRPCISSRVSSPK